VEDTDAAKTEPFMKRHRRGIRQAHACNDPVNVLAFEHSEQRRIERRAAAPPKSLRVTVNLVSTVVLYARLGRQRLLLA
jgi:hypothetical protein